jgi:hypothetical protein
METEKLIEIIKEKEITDLDEHNSLCDGVIFAAKTYTNPRRDYLGVRTYYINTFDHKCFYIEHMYGSEVEFVDCGLAERVEEKTLVWKHI